jgi:hypothetical protein
MQGSIRSVVRCEQPTSCPSTDSAGYPRLPTREVRECRGQAAAVDIKDRYGALMEQKAATRDGGAIWDRIGNVSCWDTVTDEDRYLTRRRNEFITV